MYSQDHRRIYLASSWRNANQPHVVNALRGLGHEVYDFSDTCVLLMPCGRSAHLEAGYAAGTGKRVIVHIEYGHLFEPELMYLLAAGITHTMDDLAMALKHPNFDCTPGGNR